jgi:preprotein translocase subunit SecG
MITLLTVVHVAVCLFLIVIVLLQHGKGADAGATFGGSGQSLFGTEGPVPLLNKITTAVAIIFMLTSVSLAYLTSSKSTGSVMSEVAKPKAAPVEQVEGKGRQEEKVVPMPVPGAGDQKEMAVPEKQQSASAQEAQPVVVPESQGTTPAPVPGAGNDK